MSLIERIAMEMAGIMAPRRLVDEGDNGVIAEEVESEVGSLAAAFASFPTDNGREIAHKKVAFIRKKKGVKTEWVEVKKMMH